LNIFNGVGQVSRKRLLGFWMSGLQFARGNWELNLITSYSYCKGSWLAETTDYQSTKYQQERDFVRLHY
jgi:hypothetical protein